MDSKNIKREAKKILKEKDLNIDSDGKAIITAKASGKEQIFSQYDYDRSEKLNPELADYIYEKANHAPKKAEICIKIYALSDVNEDEVKFAIKKNFERELKNETRNLRNNWKLILAMSVLGLLTLSLLFLCYAFFDNAYVCTILEIVVWVLIWEAVDAFVFSRPKIRHKTVVLLKLCTCEIHVLNVSRREKIVEK